MSSRIALAMKINLSICVKVWSCLPIIKRLLRTTGLDPKLGPGKYEYETVTRMTNNLGPTVVNKNGIVLNRSDERFKETRQRGPSPSYLPVLNRQTTSKRPFNMQSERFDQAKPNDAQLGPGFYTVSARVNTSRCQN